MASGTVLYQESQLVYKLITVINFLKHKGFTQNAKWLWLMGPDQLVGMEPSVVHDDLVAKTRRDPRRLLVSVAFVAPDDLNTEGRLLLLSRFNNCEPVLS